MEPEIRLGKPERTHWLFFVLAISLIVHSCGVIGSAVLCMCVCVCVNGTANEFPVRGKLISETMCPGDWTVCSCRFCCHSTDSDTSIHNIAHPLWMRVCAIMGLIETDGKTLSGFRWCYKEVGPMRWKKPLCLSLIMANNGCAIFYPIFLECPWTMPNSSGFFRFFGKPSRFYSYLRVMIQ